MKRKVLGILLTGLFIVGMIATVNINQTNQEENIEILKNSEANMETVNCLRGGGKKCNLWPGIGDNWWNF